MLSSVFQTTVCILVLWKLLIESAKIERSNGQLSDLIPTRNGARQGCPFSPLLSLFISDIPKLLKEGGHWSNTWHISNQLPTVCYQTIVVYLAYGLMTKVMVSLTQYHGQTSSYLYYITNKLKLSKITSGNSIYTKWKALQGEMHYRVRWIVSKSTMSKSTEMANSMPTEGFLPDIQL